MSDTSEDYATTDDQDYQDQLENAEPSMSERGPYAPDQQEGVEPGPVMEPGQQTTDEVQPQEGGPVIDEEAEAEAENTTDAETSEYDDWTVDDLKTEADGRDLTVERSDGGDGAPVKADYVAALEADDAEKE